MKHVFVPFTSIGLPFHLTKRYIIEDGHAKIVNLGSPIDTLKLEHATAKLKNQGWLKRFFCFGMGDVVINDGRNKELVWERVWFAGSKVNFINRKEFKKNYESSSSNQGINNSTSNIPEGVEFSNEVLTLPNLPTYFESGLIPPLHWMTGSSYYNNYENLQHTWINRGDTITTIKVPISFFRRKTVAIKSPVSGLVINAGVKFYFYSPEEKFLRHRHFTILLPKNESPSVSVRDLYRDVYDSMIDYRGKIFKKSGKNDQELLKHLHLLIDKNPREYIYESFTSEYYLDIIDKYEKNIPEIGQIFKKYSAKKIRFGIALAAYEEGNFINAYEHFEKSAPDYIDKEKHANACFKVAEQERKPEKKRAYYRNVIDINPSHAGARKALGLEPLKEEQSQDFKSTQSGFDGSNHSYDKDTATTNEELLTPTDASLNLNEHYRKKWNLPVGFTLMDLEDCYREIIAKTPSGNIETINKEFLILKAYAS